MATSLAFQGRKVCDPRLHARPAKDGKLASAIAPPTSPLKPLVEIKTRKDYTEWMKGLLAYDLKSFATDVERNS